MNPYNIIVGGYAPKQGELILPSGEYCYIRSRSRTSIDICDSRDLWEQDMANYSAISDVGYMSEDDLILWATSHIDQHLNTKTRNFISLYHKLND